VLIVSIFFFLWSEFYKYAGREVNLYNQVFIKSNKVKKGKDEVI